jgi:hypothetical protein
MMVQQGACGLDFDGGPGNCGMVAPTRPFDRHFMLVEWVDKKLLQANDEDAVADEGESVSLLDMVRRRQHPQPEVAG